MQMLFALDLAPLEGALDDFFAGFWDQQREIVQDLGSDPDAALRSFDGEAARPHRVFAEALVEGVLQHLGEIDARLESLNDGWPLQRMGGVDRNVLRVALYEMLYLGDTPPAVIINEAVDIAKYYSTRESGRFVNGMLDRVAKGLDKPLRFQAKDPGFSGRRA
ncbi:MAG: transcription antitermination factor NusB [Kiritimatiellae bacterium]|nr:transcription antitermination factor NusB [Kiritimatiellia bacterium]